MSSKLPQKNDPERDEIERDALEARDKTEQVVEALKQGKLPTTEQVTQTIDKIQETEAIHDAGYGMSPLGKRVLADTEKLLESTKKVLGEKNHNDEIQNAVYFGIQGAKDINAESNLQMPGDFIQKVQGETSAAEQETAQKIQETFKKIVKLPNLVMSNKEFRLLINEINEIIREAITVNDNEDDKLNNNDNNNNNNNNQGNKKKRNRKTSTHEIRDPKETTKETIKDTTQQLREGLYPAAKTVANIGEEQVKGFSEGKKSLKEATTEGAKSLQKTVQQSISKYHISEEQRDRLMNRFKNVMFETQKNPVFQDAISELIDTISQISQRTQEITKRTSEQMTAEIINNNDNDNDNDNDNENEITAIQIAIQYAKNFIENLANYKSLDPLIESVKEFSVKVQNDQELHNYLKDLRQFVLRSLRDAEFTQDENYIENGSRIINVGREILLSNYRDITQKIQKEISDFNNALQSDKTLAEWSNDINNLITDLFLDEKGRPTIKYELVKDFVKIIPLLSNKLQYIPLPGIESSDEEYDYAFDNCVLHLQEILPKHLHIGLTSEINFDRETNNMVQNTALFEISKLRADARNTAFFYKKKKGVFNMMDVGLVDFVIPDEGLKSHVKLFLDLPTEERPYLLLDILEAETTIQTLKLRLHDTNHDYLYTFLTPLVENKIKRELENLITEKMKLAVQYIQESLKKIQTKVSEFQQNTNINLIKDNSIVSSINSTSKHNQHQEELKEVWKSESFNSDITPSNKYSTEHSLAMEE